jgi:hypothetical protein
VGIRAAPSGELSVKNIEGVGRDLRNVDVEERRQVAGHDAAVLLERVRRPAPFLRGDPLRCEVAEGSSRRRLIAVGQLDCPAVALRLGVPLPGGPHDTGAVALLSGQRISAEIGT